MTAFLHCELLIYYLLFSQQSECLKSIKSKRHYKGLKTKKKVYHSKNSSNEDTKNLLKYKNLLAVNTLVRLVIGQEDAVYFEMHKKKGWVVVSGVNCHLSDKGYKMSGLIFR